MKIIAQPGLICSLQIQNHNKVSGSINHNFFNKPWLASKTATNVTINCSLSSRSRRQNLFSERRKRLGVKPVESHTLLVLYDIFYLPLIAQTRPPAGSGGLPQLKPSASIRVIGGLTFNSREWSFKKKALLTFGQG